MGKKISVGSKRKSEKRNLLSVWKTIINKNQKLQDGLYLAGILILLVPIVAFARPIVKEQITNYKQQKATVVLSPSPSPLPLKKLELGTMTKYSNGALIGEVKNIGEAKVFNVVIKFMVSKDKSDWVVDQTEYIKIPYVISPGETYKFKEYIKVPKSDPWTTSYIESSEYYAGQVVPSTPPSSQNTISANNNSGSNIDCIGPDGKQLKTSEAECKTLNESWGKTMDYMVNCSIHSSCGGGTKYMKNSDCNNQTCCHLNNGTYVLLSTKSACDNYYSNNSGSSAFNVSTNNYYPCTLCYHYSSGDKCITYNYLVETKVACDAEQGEINSLGSSYVLPVNQPTVITNPTTTTVDASACYSQYNSDIQAAKMYGGNVGSAMTDVAKSNLSSCLASGQVTAVGAIQQDIRPKDRNGKLCSEYGPEALSYSQSMGCP